MASDTKRTKRTSFPQASNAIATTALTQSLARMHTASIERTAFRLFGRKPDIVQHYVYTGIY